MRQVLKGVAAALIVCIPLGFYLYSWLRATALVAIVGCCILGLAIIVVVGTRSDRADAAADEAWRAAAPDLPPASDRRSMESSQLHMPGPRPTAKEPAAKASPGTQPVPRKSSARR